jgi:hypothetical protein
MRLEELGAMRVTAEISTDVTLVRCKLLFVYKIKTKIGEQIYTHLVIYIILHKSYKSE